MSVIAELSNNHNGDLALALRLVDGCADAGVDYIKLQAYSPAELVALRGDGPAPEPWGSQGWTMRRLYDKAATPLKWFPAIIERCNLHGVPWFSSVFGVGSLAFLEAMECPMYKLAALDYNRTSLRHEVESTGKPILRSTPYEHYPGGNARALWCPPGYPQSLESLKPLRSLMRRFDGFSYHGTDPLVPALAVAYGADMVEVHVQLDDVPSELEANVSLKVSQVAELVAMCKTAEALR